MYNHPLTARVTCKKNDGLPIGIHIIIRCIVVQQRRYMNLSRSVQALGRIGLLTVPAWADTGLEFPRTVRFKFANPHLNGLPINAWYTQGARVWSDGNGKHHEFYWDWPNTDAAHKVIWNSPPVNNTVNPPAPALTFGDAPWQPGQELCSCTLRGIQIYSSLVSLAEIQSELTAPQSTATGIASIWHMNINPTPTDISDKSGAGHNPSWVGANRATLYGEGKRC